MVKMVVKVVFEDRVVSETTYFTTGGSIWAASHLGHISAGYRRKMN